MTHDDLYEALVDAHRGLDSAQSLFLNSRLVLLLMERAGDPAGVLACIREARAGLTDGQSASPGGAAATI